MQFLDEEARSAFHDLDTDLQLILNDLEIALSEQGLFLHVDVVEKIDAHLEVMIRISEQLHHSVIN